MADATRLMLVRHGHHDWLVPPINRFAGRLPGVHLNAAGRAGVEALARYLEGAPPDRIVSSPLDRTMETAAIIGERAGRPVSTDDRLLEAGLGPWEGLPVAEVIACHPTEWQTWRTEPSRMAVPGIESVGAIADRMACCAREWAQQGGTTLLVSHQDPILALICRLLELPLDTMRRMDASPASLTAFEFVNGSPVMMALNAVAAVRPVRPGRQ